MDLRDYLRILQLRWRLIAACALAGLAAAAVANLSTTPIYQAETQLFVSTAGDNSVGGAYTGTLLTQQRVKSYVKFVSSPRVTDGVVDELGLDESPEALASRVSADAPLDTVLLNIRVQDESAEQARVLTNAVAREFIATVNDLEASTPETPGLVKLAVVRDAPLPGAPITPRTNLNLALGLLVGLAVGVGAAVLKETLDTRVKTIGDLQRIGLTALTIVPYGRDSAERPLIVQDQPRSPRAEAFRRLRTNLQFVDVDQQPRSIVITSSVPGEGKTTTAANLAIALADAGVQVVLLEGDLRKPKVAGYLGIEGAVGLTDVLIGRVSLEDALQPWGSSGNLLVLPAGALPPNPSEVLGSKHMAEVIRTLESRGIVILDAPPLLPVTDAAVLAASCSGAVFVVRARSTRREQVATSLESLTAVGGTVFGAVFNMAPTAGPDAYGYAYGNPYGYGEYSYGVSPDGERSQGAAASGKQPFSEPVPVAPTRLGAAPDAVVEAEASAEASPAARPAPRKRAPAKKRPPARSAATPAEPRSAEQVRDEVTEPVAPPAGEAPSLNGSRRVSGDTADDPAVEPTGERQAADVL